MKLRALKYLAIFHGPVLAIISFSSHGIWTFLLPIYVYGLIPLIELFLKPGEKNFSEEEEKLALNEPLYDILLYLIFPIQFFLLFYFVNSMTEPGLSIFEMTGRIVSMGLSCAVFGINIGHELGHRKNKFEQFLAKGLLLTSLYMHFFIEHNRGHHKRVSTDDDPASSRYGEILYTFWFRSVITGYISAWKLETARLKKEGKKFISIYNEMINYHIIQGTFLFLLFWLFGLVPMLCFVAAATVGFLMLETVNYIEHYGLRRKKTNSGEYEKVLPVHSWNSNHLIGRLMLFELSRHSDHHYKSSRKYQVLRHFEACPQMPTGYPGMVVLSFFPPLWFYVMHRQLDKFKKENAAITTLV